MSITVHPHAYGEHRRDFTRLIRYCGSSPRIWGTRAPSCRTFCYERFIPTHMGNTAYKGIETSLGAVHPHAYGEHQHTGSFCWVVYGSSPRIWGTRQTANLRAPVVRFIPTHMGNTTA